MINYVKMLVGSIDFNMSMYFVDVGDFGVIEIVNQVQVDYVLVYIQVNLLQYVLLLVLLVSVLFKSGFGGGIDFIDVVVGLLVINNVVDLYLYLNMVYVVKVVGFDIKNWLEMVVKCFNIIDLM